MNQVNAEHIERYQLIVEKDPSSKVFATLAEAYRKMGLIDQAIAVCLKGIEHNPKFASGYIALAKAYISKSEIDNAVARLKLAANLAPENLLAHQLLGECYLKQKKPKQALKAYKMVLFLNPLHGRAQTAVKKLESLTADEYEDEAFSMEKLSSAIKKMDFQFDQQNIEFESHEAEAAVQNEFIDRYLSLVDAYVARNDIDKAHAALLSAEQKLGSIPEIIKRKKLLSGQHRGLSQENESAEPIAPVKTDSHQQKKLNVLQNLLHSIEVNSKP